MNMVMNERFNVSRGPCWSNCSAGPRTEAESFDAKAGRVRDIGISQATYCPGLLRLAHPDGVAGHGARLRLRRRRRRAR